MKRIFQLLVFGAYICFSNFTTGQVLNIEDERIVTDTTGWAGSTKLSFDFSKNTVELLKSGINMHVQYKTDKSLYLLLGDYKLTKGTDTEYENAGIIHLRYNYKFLDWLTGEAFIQSQFNKMLKIDQRSLTGAGPRFRVIKTKPFRLYFASLYMYEYEELKEFDKYNRDHRISSYMSFFLKLGETLMLTNTTYFQPKIIQFNDFRISSQLNLIFKISKFTSYMLSYHYYLDKYPTPTIPQETHSLTNSLIFNF